MTNAAGWQRKNPEKPTLDLNKPQIQKPKRFERVERIRVFEANERGHPAVSVEPPDFLVTVWMATQCWEEIMMKVFCCHSSQDKDAVKPAALSLKQVGHEVFFDEWSLAAGDSLVDKIPQAIADSGTFILFLSAASKASAWCQRELAIAVSQMIKSRKIRVLAFRLQPVDPPLCIDDMVYIDAVKYGFDKAVEILKLAVEGKPAPVEAQEYSDVKAAKINVDLTGQQIPSPYYAAVQITAKRFQHPNYYFRVTTNAPLSKQAHCQIENFTGMRTFVSSAVSENVFEHTEGPPGLMPNHPLNVILFSKQPVEITGFHFEEQCRFEEVCKRAGH